MATRTPASVFSARVHIDSSCNVDQFALEDAPDRVAHILVLARNEPRRPLDDSHSGAEAAEDLRELEANVAAAEHDQVLRHGVEFQDGRVR